MTTEELKKMWDADNAARRVASDLNIRWGDYWGHYDLMQLIANMQDRIEKLESMMETME